MSTALIGLHGTLGKYFLEALTSPEFYFQPVHVVARDISGTKSTDKVIYHTFDELDDVVKKADVVISVAGPPAAYDAVLKALEKAKDNVKLYIPCTYGCDFTQLDYLPVFVPRAKHIDTVRSFGIKTVNVTCGLFNEPGSFFYERNVEIAGVFPKDHTVQFIGSPDQEFRTTELSDLGKSVAVTASYVNKDVSALPDNLRIYSDVITPRKVLEVYKKHHPDFKYEEKEPIPVETATKEAQEKLKNGFKFEDFLFYLQVIAANGLNKGLSTNIDDRDLVNPGESKWKWHKYE